METEPKSEGTPTPLLENSIIFFFFFEPFPYGVNVTYLNTVKQAGPAL